MSKRGRPRKDPENPKWARIDAERQVAAIKKQEQSAEERKKNPGAAPKFIDGKPNPQHWRDKVAMVSDLCDSVTRGEKEFPRGFNPKQVQEFYAFEAAAYGIDPESIADLRSDAEKLEDAVDRILEDSGALFEVSNHQITLLEAAMNDVERIHDEDMNVISESYIREESRRAGEDHERRLKRARLGKEWAGLLERLRRLRERAKTAWHPDWPMADPELVSAMLPLRYMLYVGRSTLDGQQAIFKVGRHMTRLAWEIYQARQGKRLNRETGKWAEDPREGCLCVLPPGMGKTTVAAHFFAMELSRNPMLRLLIGHAQEGEAKKNLAYLTTCFDPKTPNGRRNLALFPGVRIERSNSDVLKLKTKETIRQWTASAHGIKAKVSGSDADLIWFDDPCDQDLASQESQREIVFDRMNGTWRARKRGTKTFELTTTTLWHHDDPNCRRIALYKQGKLRIGMCVQRCGGPSEHPPFKSIWPEVYPASRLRAIFEEWRNPRLFAAAFQCNPQPDNLRKIKRLAFYDPKTEEHREFMKNAMFWITLDPAAKKRAEAQRHNDQAVMLYAALGDVREEMPNGEVHLTRRLRFIDSRAFHASQSECVSEVMAFSQRVPVHYVLCECKGTTSGTVELFEAQGLFDVIPYDPKNRDKGARLDEVAVLLDDSIRDHGLPGAVIEFPGRVVGARENRLKCHPDWYWVERQIVEFGSVGRDDALDAVTQLARYLMPQLDVGAGSFTEKVAEVVQTGDRRILRMIAEVEGRALKGRAEQQDWDFSVRSGWSSQ